MEPCRIECIILSKNSVKVFWIYFSYNKKIENEENFIKHIKNLSMFLFNIWGTRNLAVQGKITVFKTLAISKIIHFALVTNVPPVISDQFKQNSEYLESKIL